MSENNPLFNNPHNIYLYSENSEDEHSVNSENAWIDNFTLEEISAFDMVFDMNFYIPHKKRYPVKIKITGRKKATPPFISLEDI